MNKLLFIYLLISIKLLSCSSNFTFEILDEKVHFNNLSVANNAHFYWDFGNGISSNIKNPSHKYFDNGNYLVTLYVLDTVTGCSDFKEEWIVVTKSSNNTCSTFLTDSLFFQSGGPMIKFRPSNSTCNGGSLFWYTVFWHVAQNSNTMSLPLGPANLVSAGRFGSSPNWHMATKTTTINFDKTKNYSPCSANFEYSVVSEDIGGQRILLKAMNKNASNYNWAYCGNGTSTSTYYGSGDTISMYINDGTYLNYPYVAFPWNISLKISESNGCTDSLWQSVILRPKSVTTSIKDLQSNNLNVRVYPNPTKDKINLQFSPNENSFTNIEISNSLGQTIYSIKNTRPSGDNMQIELVAYSSGIYFLKIKNDRGQKMFKLVKE